MLLWNILVIHIQGYKVVFLEIHSLNSQHPQEMKSSLPPVISTGHSRILSTRASQIIPKPTCFSHTLTYIDFTNRIVADEQKGPIQ